MIQGINLIFFVPTALIAIFINLKIIGAIIGSNIAFKISDDLLKKLFVFFLSIITIYEIYVYFNKYILKEKKK